MVKRCSVLCVGFLLWASTTAHAFDTALYTHCLQWTPDAVASSLYAAAVQEGIPQDVPGEHIYGPSARKIYTSAEQWYFGKRVTGPRTIAEWCALIATEGTAVLAR